ncbi:MAG: S9 family peptidase [Acholeplasmatales bacterium]|nr:MAG: S9 family peptidase [Acholeplasmatales bacterium]
MGVFTLSEDMTKLYYTAADPRPVTTLTAPIYAYDLKHHVEEVVYTEAAYSILALIEMRGQLIAAARDMKTYGMSQNPDFFKVENQALVPFAIHSESLGTTIGSDARLIATPTAAVRDGVYYFTTTIDDHSELRALYPDGTIKTLWVMDGAIDGFVPYQSGGLLIGMQGQALQELYALDVTKASLKRLTRLNASVFKNRYVATPHVIEVKAPSHTVKGFVLLPENYDPRRTYPAILNIHGGPKTVYGQVYYHEMQVWANMGYVVCFANPRGSDGKGNKFADIRGRYGSIDYEDLMAFTDTVLDTYPNIDRTQLFVTGGSYGGFMTNWIIGHTNRFKAAVTQRSISNWLSFYGTSDIGYYFASDQTDGHPLDDREKLYDQSPIKYARAVKTPLLFIHADQDHRCPIEQAQQFYAVLKTQGLDTKLVWIKDENHELSRSGKPQARLKRLTEITNWFMRYTHA